MKSALLALGLLLPLTALAEIPANNPLPGGIAVVTLGPVVSPALSVDDVTPPIIEDQVVEENIPVANIHGGDMQTPIVKPQARFGNRPLMVVQDQGSWKALIGLPCTLLPGNYIVSITDNDGGVSSLEVGVLPRVPKHAAAGADESNNQTRSQSQQDQNNEAADTRLHDELLTLPDGVDATAVLNPVFAVKLSMQPGLMDDIEPAFEFRHPVEYQQRVDYGKLVTGQELALHDYVSFLTQPGSQVYAPAAGMVLAIESSTGQGDTVYLGHGSGMLSIIGHMQTVELQVGQVLNAGEQIGTSRTLTGFNQNNGNAGRLDWGLMMNGYLIDPLQFAASS